MQYRAEAAWPRPDSLTIDQLDDLTAAVPGFGAVVDDGHLYLYASMDVEAGTLTGATTTAVAAARDAYAAAFGEPVEPVQVAVFPPDLGLVPGPLDLVGTGDVARDLGKHKSRASQYVQDGRLPAPLGHPGGAPVWVRSAVTTVAARWELKPGRPAHAAK